MARKSKKQNKVFLTLAVIIVAIVVLQYIPGFKNITGKTVCTVATATADCPGEVCHSTDFVCVECEDDADCTTAGETCTATNICATATTCTVGQIDTANNKYCLSNTWLSQIVDDSLETCNYNYKCESNICKNGKCLSQTTLIDKYCDVLVYMGDYVDLASCETVIQAQLTP